MRRDKCPGCGNATACTLYSCPFPEDPIRSYVQEALSLTRLNGTFAVAECTACGLMFQREILNEEGQLDLYDRGTIDEASTQFASDEPLVAGPQALLGVSLEVLRVLFALGKKPSDVTMLDFGMGWGIYGRIATGLGSKCYGVEVSATKREVAKAFGVTPVSLDEAEQQSLRFDYINADQVFEHLSEPYGVLVRLVGLLLPQGLIKISVPNATGARRLLRNPDWRRALSQSGSHMNVFAPLEHVNAFRGHSLRAMADRAGLARIDVPEVAVRRLPNRTLIERLKDPLKQIYARTYFWSERNSTHLFFGPR